MIDEIELRETPKKRSHHKKAAKKNRIEQDSALINAMTELVRRMVSADRVLYVKHTPFCHNVQIFFECEGSLSQEDLNRIHYVSDDNFNNPENGRPAIVFDIATTFWDDLTASQYKSPVGSFIVSADIWFTEADYKIFSECEETILLCKKREEE